MDFTIFEKNSKEFWGKIQWFIKLRWVIVMIALFIELLNKGLLGPSVIYLKNAPLFELITTLSGANIIFHLINIHYFNQKEEKLNENIFIKRNLIFFFAQVFVDYFCVTNLIAHFGFLNFSLVILYLPHIILTSVIINKKIYSFMVLWISLFIIYYLIFIQRDKINFVYFYGGNKEYLLSGPIIYAVFITGVFQFIHYLVNLLVGVIVKDRNELYQINKKLILMDREKQNYTLRATHELKAPFAAIQSYIQVILAGYLGEVNLEIKEILVKIDTRCASLSKMIKNIIQLSNLKTSVFLDNNFASCEIIKLIRQRLEVFTVQAKGKEIELVFETLLEENFKLTLVANLFEILVDNLVSNAIQYSPSKSKILVKAEILNFDTFKLSVKDNGIGIPKENHKKIFDEHFRCDNAAAFSQSGNGMGLAIVREIIRLHDASIEVESELNKGTEFTVKMGLK